MSCFPGIVGLDAVPLEAAHDVDSFDCGSGLLNTYLTRYALAEQKSAKVRTYVLIEDTRVIGYYSVGAGVVEATLCRDCIDRRLRRQVIPVLVVARIAVDRRRQQHGIGGALLRQVEARGACGAGVVGARAVVAAAIGRQARSFLVKHGYEPLPGDRYRLYRPLRLGGAEAQLVLQHPPCTPATLFGPRAG